MKSHLTQFTWVIVFSIAMGFLEAAVVIYLRTIYYEHGFQFPLTEMEPQLALTEVLREAATLVMLIGIGVLAGRSLHQRFSFFVLAFAVWDIFYYIFLKMMIDWPESFLTWDILFLLPVPWIGPVLAPCLVSLTMILFSIIIYNRDIQNSRARLNRREWLLVIGGSFMVFLSWTWDYFNMEGYPLLSIQKSLFFFSTYVPQSYNWWMFGTGEVLLLAGILFFFIRTRTLSIKMNS